MGITVGKMWSAQAANYFPTITDTATHKKVVVAMHKCECPKDNRWFEYLDKVCCYEIAS